MKLRVGTRTSKLALAQTRQICRVLANACPDLEIEEVHVSTQGDRDAKTPLHQQSTIGLFTKALEEALGDGRIDLAVHSLKDLPTQVAPGLELGAIPIRANPWDAFISARYPHLIDMPPGSVVATGSIRRQAEIRYHYPHLDVVGIRGNIDTRLANYAEVGSALILAAAGLERAGLSEVVRSELSLTEMTPAPGQGALALEIRAECPELAERLARVHDPATELAVSAERSVLELLGGGCSLPLGSFGRVVGGNLILTATVTAPDGSERIQQTVEAEVDLTASREQTQSEARRVAEGLVEKLDAKGARRLLELAPDLSPQPDKSRPSGQT